MGIVFCRRAVLHNIKYDERVVAFANAAGAGAKNTLFLSTMAQHAQQSQCTAMSFRTGTPLDNLEELQVNQHLDMTLDHL